jgi:hypothetical protein
MVIFLIAHASVYNDSCIGALALWEVPVIDSNFMSRFTFIDNLKVSCHSYETTLLNCPHNRRRDSCRFGGDAGVKCREEELRVKNVSIANIDMPCCIKRTVRISWELHDSTSSHKPSSFTVTCFNQQHHTELSMINGTNMQILLGDLLPSVSYTCCVSATYYGNYETEERCTMISTEMLQSDLLASPTKYDRADIIGGVLGFIVVILALLLAICGGALVYVLRSRGMTPQR